MKKSIIFHLLFSALLLIGCSSPNESHNHHNNNGDNNPYEPYNPHNNNNETVEVRIYFINGATTVEEVDKGSKFIIDEYYEGYNYKAYTDELFSIEYIPTNLTESITLYAREDDGKNVLALYDIVDDEPTLTSLGAYSAQSGLYAVDFGYQLYTNKECTTPISINSEILIPNQGLKLYRKGYTNPDYYQLTVRHYQDGVYDKEDSYVGAVDYIARGTAFKNSSGIPYSEWDTTTFQFDNGQTVDDNTYYVFLTGEQVILNCYMHRGTYKSVAVYDYDTGDLLDIIPWSIEDSFFGSVRGYEYSGVIEWNWSMGKVVVANVQKLISNLHCEVYNGHVVRTWTTYTYKSSGFSYEYQDRDYYFDVDLTNPVEHRTYNTDITTYSLYRGN